MFVVNKIEQGLNLICKPPNLSFARKALPSGCLVAHFEKGSLIALQHNLRRGYGHTDQVPNPTHPQKKLPFSCSLHNIDMKYESVADVLHFVICCCPSSILTGVGVQYGAPDFYLPSIPIGDGYQYVALELVPIGAGCPFGCSTLIC